MRTLAETQVLVRIFIGESDRHHHRPLYEVLLERLRKDGFAGATVFRGIAGFGASSVMHTQNLLELSEDLPMVIEVVDAEDRVPLLMCDVRDRESAKRVLITVVEHVLAQTAARP